MKRVGCGIRVWVLAMSDAHTQSSWLLQQAAEPTEGRICAPKISGLCATLETIQPV